MGFGEPLEREGAAREPRSADLRLGPHDPDDRRRDRRRAREDRHVYEKWEAPERIVVPARRDRGGHRAARCASRSAAGSAASRASSWSTPTASPTTPPPTGRARRSEDNDAYRVIVRAARTSCRRRVPRRVQRRRQRRRLPLHRHARRQRDPGGVRVGAGHAVAARPAAHPGPAARCAGQRSGIHPGFVLRARPCTGASRNEAGAGGSQDWSARRRGRGRRGGRSALRARWPGWRPCRTRPGSSARRCFVPASGGGPSDRTNADPSDAGRTGYQRRARMSALPQKSRLAA